jgi:predicted nucleotidyltransferase
LRTQTESDINLLAAFDHTRPVSPLDVIHIETQIAEMLGASVDLIEEETLKPRVQKGVEAEVIRAF